MNWLPPSLLQPIRVMEDPPTVPEENIESPAAVEVQPMVEVKEEISQEEEEEEEEEKYSNEEFEVRGEEEGGRYGYAQYGCLRRTMMKILRAVRTRMKKGVGREWSCHHQLM